jgi:tRNA (adenine22-N1)-methyltransferase
MPLNLRPRLMALAVRVPVGARVADIGTDHGRLPLWLLQNGIVKHAFAVDKAEGPLSQAKALAAHCGLAGRLECIAGDGLLPLPPDSVDTVVIAGMGGESIALILSESPWALRKHLLLQPMSRIEKLEKFLTENDTVYAKHEVTETKRRYVFIEILPAPPGRFQPPDGTAV